MFSMMPGWRQTQTIMCAYQSFGARRKDSQECRHALLKCITRQGSKLRLTLCDYASTISGHGVVAENNTTRLLWACELRSRTIKSAIGRPYVHALVDSCDSLRVAKLFMRRRYFDLCVAASSRTMHTFGNNVSCSSSACSNLASNLR